MAPRVSKIFTKFLLQRFQQRAVKKVIEPFLAIWSQFYTKNSQKIEILEPPKITCFELFEILDNFLT